MANKDLIINSDATVEEKVIGLLICSGAEYTSKLTRAIKEFDLSLTQLYILHILSKSKDGILTVNQIKDLMIDESPNVSRSLNKLMENNCIVKERKLDDQRVVYIKITKNGRELHIEADKKASKVSTNLTHDEKKALIELLKNI